MNIIHFYKYQGTGNDFIMIDDRLQIFPDKASVGEVKVQNLIKWMCDRKFGIGADGLILIQDHAEVDFEMVYFNADASQSMCGNGSRCAVHFAKQLGIINNETFFQAIDGRHHAFIKNGLIHLKMGEVSGIQKKGDDLFIHTGSPHYITFVEDVHSVNIFEEGRKIRYSKPYIEKGTNVNFVEVVGKNEVFVRTYERGVENETLSCGTGVTAVALACSGRNMKSPLLLQTLGGKLKVSFNKLNENAFSEIYLIGPGQMVFKGEIDIKL